MSLIKVWTDIGNEGKCYSLPAKIVSKKGNTFVVQYLSSTDRKTRDGKKIYMNEDETYEVTDNSITEYLETDSELDLGFEQISGSGDFEFIKYDSDSEDEDYIPSEEDSDSESSSDDDEDSDSCEEDDICDFGDDDEDEDYE
jgi:hypothetical protein